MSFFGGDFFKSKFFKNEFFVEPFFSEPFFDDTTIAHGYSGGTFDANSIIIPKPKKAKKPRTTKPKVEK